MENIPQKFETLEMKRLDAQRTRILDAATARGGKEEHSRVFDLMNEQALDLADRYTRSECYKVAAYHVLIGSGMPALPKQDFEGEDSIPKYLDDLEKQL